MDVILTSPSEIDYEILNSIDLNKINYAYSLVKKHDNNGIFMVICKFLLGRIKYKEYTIPCLNSKIFYANKEFILSNMDENKFSKNIICIITWLCGDTGNINDILINHPVGYFKYSACTIDYISKIKFNKIKHFGWKAILFWVNDNHINYQTESFHLLNYIKKYTMDSNLYKWLATFYYYGIGCNINKEKSQYYFSLVEECTSDDQHITQYAYGININIGELFYIVNGIDKGRDAWYLVLIKPSELFTFVTSLNDPLIHLGNHGSVILSGWGERKIKDVKHKIKNIYKYKHVLYRHMKNIDEWSDEDLNKIIFTEPYDINETFNGTFNCPICFENDNILNNWICYTCCTSFHEHCYKKWLKINPSCPICRSKNTL